MRHALALAVPAGALAIVLVVAVVPADSAVVASDMFGGLRAPGEPAFIAGHRGDRSVAPENTMPSLEAALANPALGFVETDVQLTRDGVPVLFHDTTIERVTGRSGSIADYDYARLRSFDAGAWYAKKFRGERIPTLARLLDALRQSQKRALVELKFAWTPEEVKRVADLIDARGLAGGGGVEGLQLEKPQRIPGAPPPPPPLPPPLRVTRPP